ncbi:hypothetical protein FBZ94_1021102 [Bradyrhizobium sacchari]|uniref:Uncharacterized protein n=1 Tax=Bradyrhizobium sacchari TaxID=1399419 RepID=A0A560JAM8_9BRAD|nr:hypothetical protein FBZ94_1021102 [Bradyrhizobium sacchari]TWB81874.1 hypothetical protein FBZ95_1021103 [Bradyrhizobium sacchari]
MPRLVRTCALGRGIQYSAAFVLITKVTAYWIARFRGR